MLRKKEHRAVYDELMTADRIIEQGEHKVHASPTESSLPQHLEILRQTLNHYHQVPQQEKKAYLDKVYKLQPNGFTNEFVYNQFPQLWVNDQTQICFGFDVELKTLENPIIKQCQQETGIDPQLLLLHAAHLAAQKSLNIHKELQQFCHDQSDPIPAFPMRIVQRFVFDTPMFGADLISVGEEYVYRLARAVLKKNESEISQAMTAIASQFFHEHIHQLSSDTYLNNQTHEEITQLGEFLYDPQNNLVRNEIFNEQTVSAFSFDERQQDSNQFDTHLQAWKHVTLIILLYELKERGLLPHNSTLIAEVALHLPKLYAQISEKERMEILKKWIILPKEELYIRCQNLSKDLTLLYSLPNSG